MSGRKGERWTKEEMKMIVKKVKMGEVKIKPIHFFVCCWFCWGRAEGNDKNEKGGGRGTKEFKV